MTFAWPNAFWLLAIPFALVVWDRVRGRKQAGVTFPKILRAEAGMRQLSLGSERGAGFGRFRPRILMALGLAFGVTALARPQWGTVEEQVYDQSREILIAMDLSRSMLVSDVKPSRLERSKLLVQALLERLQGERVGLLLFAGTAFVQSPLSADYEILKEFLPLLSPRYLPEGGSNYARMLDSAIESFTAGGGADRFLVVLSDGESTDSGWRDRLPGLKDKQIRVIGLGVGTAEGGLVPDGGGGYAKDERGAVVLSKLDAGTLEELANETGGAYRDASAWVDLAALLQQTVSTGRQGTFVEQVQRRRIERFQWPLAVSLAFLLLGLWFEFPIRPRPRDIQLASGGGDAAGKLALVLLAGLIAFARPASAAEETPLDTASAPLAMLVNRLSLQDSQSASDWAEMAGTTITWGQQIKGLGQPVPEGPVRDGLAAVTAGSALDAGAADWPKLRSDLRDLLDNPDEEQPPPPPDQDQQQPQEQKEGGEESSPQNQQGSDTGQSKQSDQSQDSQGGNNDQQQQQPGDQQTAEQEKSDDDSRKNTPPADMKDAFSDYDDYLSEEEQEQQQQPPQVSQKVGGSPPPRQELQQADPSLTMTLQRLDQLREQDSPAELYYRMDQAENPDRPKNQKDW